MRSAYDFFRAALVSRQTFNLLRRLARGGDGGTGRLPIRARGVDPGLPTDGRGRFEWRGLLAARHHPRGIVRSGVLNNWNNKPARGFPAADNQFADGPIHRVDLLNRNTAKHRRHTLASLTAAMNAAATQDVRVMDLLPVLSAVLRGGRMPSARAKRMLELLEAWRRHGGSRLDRDLDGRIDDPGAAVMDAAWPRLADAAMVPRLGRRLADELATAFLPRFQAPPGGQNAGWHVYMDKDLRTLLGRKVRGTFHNRYCGRGSLARCRADLWAATDAAGAELAASRGRTRMRGGRTRRASGSSRARLLTTTVRYTNRPSGIEQVISFRRHRRVSAGRRPGRVAPCGSRSGRRSATTTRSSRRTSSRSRSHRAGSGRSARRTPGSARTAC